jgi:antitoxin YefM
VLGGVGGDGLVFLDIAQKLVQCLIMEIVTYSETRANLKAIMDRAVNDHTPIAITRQRGKPVVMVDLDDWNSLHETLYLLSSPANAKRLNDSIANADAGNLIEVDPETMQPL